MLRYWGLEKMHIYIYVCVCIYIYIYRWCDTVLHLASSYYVLDIVLDNEDPCRGETFLTHGP